MRSTPPFHSPASRPPYRVRHDLPAARWAIIDGYRVPHVDDHVALPPGIGVDGVVMADQVRSVDARARGVRRLTRAPDALLDEVLAIVDAMLF